MTNNIKAFYKGFIPLCIFTIPLLLNSCGLWSDFTTYFNLYYNASRLFDETEGQLKEQQKTLFTIQETKPQGNVSQNLTKVIEKLSKLLQFDSKSGYVDDALLMIGKSFFYQQEYQKGLRKFTEMISTFPNSDLTLEAQLWIGKTQLRLKNFAQAKSIYDQVIKSATDDGNDNVLNQALIEQVNYLISQGNYTEAVTSAEKFVESSGDDDLNAQAVYEIGNMYLKLDQPEKAAKAFASVQKYSPSFETQYMSKIQYGKVQRKIGNTESALEIFKDIEQDAKYNTSLDSTKLQIGITLMDLKRFDEAFKEFAFIDSSYRQSPNSGTANYYMGEIVEHQAGKYDSAAVFYKKASTSAAPADFILKANRKVQTFAKYDNLQSSVAVLKKQLVYLDHPEEFVKDSIEYKDYMAIQDSLAKERDKLKTTEEGELQASRNNRNERFGQNQSPALAGGDQKNSSKRIQPLRPLISRDSVNIVLAKNTYELGSLFFTELNVLDSARYYYTYMLDSLSKTPYTARSLYALGTYYQTIKDTVKADSLFEVVYKNYPNESIVNSAAEKLGKPSVNLKYDAAEELYVAAEKKMNEKNFNEAITEFKQVFEKYPKSPFAAKALYATGWVYENNLKRLDSAAVVYDSVLSKFPATQYANNVRGKVQMYKDEQRRQKAVQDSINFKNNPPTSRQLPGKDSLVVADSLKNKVNPVNQQSVNGNTTPVNGNIAPGINPAINNQGLNNQIQKPQTPPGDSTQNQKKLNPPVNDQLPNNQLKQDSTKQGDPGHQSRLEQIPVKTDSLKNKSRTDSLKTRRGEIEK